MVLGYLRATVDMPRFRLGLIFWSPEDVSLTAMVVVVAA